MLVDGTVGIAGYCTSAGSVAYGVAWPGEGHTESGQALLRLPWAVAAQRANQASNVTDQLCMRSSCSRTKRTWSKTTDRCDLKF